VGNLQEIGRSLRKSVDTVAGSESRRVPYRKSSRFFHSVTAGEGTEEVKECEGVREVRE